MKSLEEILQDSNEKKFFPSLHSVRKYSRLLNRELFENTLTPITYVDIRQRKGVYARYKALEDDKTLLQMNNWYKSKKFFLEILAHELIHHYQFLNNQKQNHGKTFKHWKPIFKEKGLSLDTRY